MTGRGREIAAILTNRKIDIAWAEKKKNIISVYAPQVGCSEDEKLTLWEELDDVLQSIPDKEGLVVIGDSMVMLVWKEQTWKGGTDDTVMTS